MSTDLLERRAERGQARGAANVWANAQMPAEQPEHPKGSWFFRFAVAALVVVAGNAALLALAGGSTIDTAGQLTDATQQASEADVPDIRDFEPLPAPYLFDGQELVTKSQPSVPGADERNVFVVESDPVIPSDEELVVFAESPTAFDGPIFVLGPERGNGVDVAGVNMSSEERTAIGDLLVRVDSQWTLPPESGLVEVARFTSADFLTSATWAFSFGVLRDTEGNQPVEPHQAFLVARPMENPTPWNAIAEIATRNETTSIEQIRPDTLDGTVLEVTTQTGSNDRAVWTDDEFVYVLDEAAALRDLRIADRQEWIDAWDQARGVREPLSSLNRLSGPLPFALLNLGFIALALLIWWGVHNMRTRRTNS